jgi:hypothetical protein
MATNMALKRGKKAQRRKQQVAEKRKIEAQAMSLPNRVLRAARAPIQRCFVQQNLFGLGIGTLVLARGASSYQVTMGSFLLDVFCLGVKDVMFKSLGDEEFEFYLDAVEATSPLVQIDPGVARRLLRDLAAWSQSFGFAPHRDFAAVEQLFGDVEVNASGEPFRFGRDGRPVYMPGPGESPLQIRRNVEQLQKALGDGGFDFSTAA